MGLFVDEITNRSSEVIRRMLMSNMSVDELNAMATSLGIPLVAEFRIDRLPHYLLTAQQRTQAIAEGAKPIVWKSPEWITVHGYAKNLPRQTLS